jgi:hypothetical protein
MAMTTISRKLIEDLMFGTGRVRRFTQDSPVLPDVWLEYAMAHVGQGDADDERQTKKTNARDTHPPVRLLLTPHAETSAGTIARRLRERLKAERRKPEWRRFGATDTARPPRVVYNQSTAAAELYFEDLVRVVLPMTEWWHKAASPLLLKRKDTDWLPLVKNPERATVSFPAAARVRPEMLWMIRVVGVLALEHGGDPLPARLDRKGLANATDAEWTQVIAAALTLATSNFTPADRDARVYSVSLNREAGPTVFRSTLSVKADAARRLFAIDCSHLVWAVVDSGIDARHPAFRLRDAGASPERPAVRKTPFATSNRTAQNNTRVKATYDFTGLHLLLDPGSTDELPDRIRKRLQGGRGAPLRKTLAALHASVDDGRPLDWGLLAPLIEIPHDGGYTAPVNDHGTHVAGILAGDWRTWDNAQAGMEGDLTGICPDMRLYDLRVLDDSGRGDEFAVMAALQLVRHLNAANEYMSIHGINLSLSIPHDVSNYACGRTPVCDECERVVGSGVVVVAAAGNQGYRRLVAPDGVTMELYSSSSITDPGNADQVITVGATHRYRPHMYGVSYFSSRGPTGDGRLKPDLVAPGEKITAPLPNDSYGVKDGTSMAAPHVSGAAALLMARHHELVGRPARVKQVLCSTATDLGRERYFQGAGMLDILRALQSI